MLVKLTRYISRRAAPAEPASLRNVGLLPRFPGCPSSPSTTSNGMSCGASPSAACPPGCGTASTTQQTASRTARAPHGVRRRGGDSGVPSTRSRECDATVCAGAYPRRPCGALPPRRHLARRVEPRRSRARLHHRHNSITLDVRTTNTRCASAASSAAAHLHNLERANIVKHADYYRAFRPFVIDLGGAVSEVSYGARKSMT